MGLFHRVDDAVVILISKGVFRQAPVFERDGRLYAGHGSGFIGLSHGTTRGTTLPKVNWLEIQGVKTQVDELGRLEVEGTPRGPGWHRASNQQKTTERNRE